MSAKTYTIECQYTGVKFTAASKRAKNHPQIADLLADSNRINLYSVVIDSLKSTREAGETDINVFRANAKTAMREAIAKRDAENAKRRETQNAIDANKRARDERNAHLRQHGYRWHKRDDEDEVWPADLPDWVLLAPDGKVVSERQALDEIERGVEVVRAEIAAAAAAHKAKREAVETERAELIARIEATGLQNQVDWSWDDFRYSIGAVIEETEHFTARQYLLRPDEVLGFVIKQK